MNSHVALRDVLETDLPIFYEHQNDPQATAMAAFPARDREAHMAHWARILANPDNIMKTIEFDGQVAGNLVSWDASGERDVGYWIGREFWGKGIATRALRLFLDEYKRRPLHAHVARHNAASRRVLEKCGFVVTGAAGAMRGNDAEPVAELKLRLD
jgi:RimJ/RimL family protein N-acetyltransferase